MDLKGLFPSVFRTTRPIPATRNLEFIGLNGTNCRADANPTVKHVPLSFSSRQRN